MNVPGIVISTVRMTKDVTTVIQIWYWMYNMSDANHPLSFFLDTLCCVSH